MHRFPWLVLLLVFFSPHLAATETDQNYHYLQVDPVFALLGGLDLAYQAEISATLSLRMRFRGISTGGEDDGTHYKESSLGLQWDLYGVENQGAYLLAEIGQYDAEVFEPNWEGKADDNIQRIGMGYAWQIKDDVGLMLEYGALINESTSILTPSGSEEEFPIDWASLRFRFMM